MSDPLTLVTAGGAAYRLLKQDRYWTPQGGEPTPLEELSDDHLRNLLRFLRQRAERLVSLAYWGAAIYWGDHIEEAGDMASLAIEQFADEEAERMLVDPLGWFEETPLIRRLVALTPPLAPAEAPPLPDEVTT